MTLADEVLAHWSAYLLGKPVISDTEFDILCERLRREDPDSPALQHLGPAGEVEHLEPMLSLAKVRSEAEIQKWFMLAGVGPQELIVMPKLDGLAVALRYSGGRLVRATTRGDGRRGEDVTRHLRLMVPQELDLEGEVRGEVVLRRDRLKEAGGKNCRNAAVGLLKSESTERTRLLDFVAWGVVGDGPDRGDFVYAGMTASMNAMWLERHKFVVASPLLEFSFDNVVFLAESSFFDHDGAVIAVDSLAHRDELGATDHHPRWAVAYKPKAEARETRVVAVEWQVGRTGVVTPVLVVEPVDLDGATVTRVTGHNAATMEEWGAGVGSRVMLSRRGGVIPHVEEVLTRFLPYPVPLFCEECMRPLRRDGRVLTHDPKTCRGAQFVALEYFLQTIGVDGFGEATLRSMQATRLLDLRVSNTPKHFVAAMQKVRQSGVPLVKALEAVGYPLAERLARRFRSWRRVEAATREELLAVEGVGPAVADDIERVDVSMLRDLVEECGVAVTELSDGPLTGLVFCFTGELKTMSRSTAEKAARAAGADVSSSVTRRTTHLVAAGESSSEKYKKATARGIVIVDEAAFVALVGKVDVRREVVDLTRRES